MTCRVFSKYYGDAVDSWEECCKTVLSSLVRMLCYVRIFICVCVVCSKPRQPVLGPVHTRHALIVELFDDLVVRRTGEDQSVRAKCRPGLMYLCTHVCT